MTAPSYKLAIGVTINSTGAKTGGRETVQAVDAIGTAVERNTTKLQALINKQVGIGAGPANQNVREWTGALAAQGKSIDDLRAKYNPLFAVIREYKASLTEIRTLQAQGILKTDEMTAAITRQRQATLASIEAIKGRKPVFDSLNDNAGGFRRQNLGYQLFDIGQGAASGMPMSMIAAQQLPQIAQLYAGPGGGIKMLLKDIGGIATGAVSAIGAMPLALAAAGTAAVLYDRNVASASAKAEAALEKHEHALERIKGLFDASGEASARYGQRVQSAIGFEARSDQRNLEEALDAQTRAAGKSLLNAVPRGSGAAFTNLYGPYLDTVQHFIAEAQQGRGDVAAFNEEVLRIAEQNPADAKLQRIAERLRETTRGATETKEQIRALNDELARTTLLTARTDAAAAATRYRIENADALSVIGRRLSAELAGLGARSPAEMGEAARARVRAEPVNPREGVDVRLAREASAGILAQAQAEQQLREAQEQRLRSLDSAVSSQQLELSLIGKTVGETERLRMEYQLTAQLKEEAARTNTEVDQTELDLIRQKSEAYGRLAETIASTNMLRDQSRTLETARTELSLVSASDETRRRSLALLQAEQQLQERGISASSDAAIRYRQQALQISEVNAQIARQAGAWDMVRSTGEGTIDTLIDKLTKGDFEGALESIASDWSKTLLTLGASNPMKNAWLGTNLPTLSDAGGLGGIFSRLLGGGDQTVGAMTVSAGSVVVTGGIAGGVGDAGGLLGKLTGSAGTPAAANDNVGGSGAQLAWNFWKSKGLADHQVAGILGNIKAESSFNPLAIGDSGKAFGLYQHNDRSAGLLSAIGGRGNLGDALAQHRFAYSELMGPENRAWQALLASKDVKGATAAFAGFERPSGFSWESPETAHNFIGRLQGANDALTKFGGSTNSAADGLGTLGTGFDKFGSALGNAGNGGGAGGGFFGSLFSSLISPQYRMAMSGTLGVGLFDRGGYTGAGGIHEPAGIVHRGEIVWSQRDIARAGGVAVVDAMRLGRRGYSSGGVVDITPFPMFARQAANSNAQGGSASSGFSQIIHNYSGQDVRTEERDDGRGGRQQLVTIGEPIAAAIRQRGNPVRSAIQSEFGARPQRVQR